MYLPSVEYTVRELALICVIYTLLILIQIPSGQGCSAQICSGGALIKEYIMQKLVKQSYFSINETCCNPHYE